MKFNILAAVDTLKFYVQVEFKFKEPKNNVEAIEFSTPRIF